MPEGVEAAEKEDKPDKMKPHEFAARTANSSGIYVVA
jgi:hypothetical protein